MARTVQALLILKKGDRTNIKPPSFMDCGVEWEERMLPKILLLFYIETL
jgi:hypothetical protein